jgi:hypothetical protein
LAEYILDPFFTYCKSILGIKNNLKSLLALLVKLKLAVK